MEAFQRSLGEQHQPVFVPFSAEHACRAVIEINVLKVQLTDLTHAHAGVKHHGDDEGSSRVFTQLGHLQDRGQFAPGEGSRQSLPGACALKVVGPNQPQPANEMTCSSDSGVVGGRFETGDAVGPNVEPAVHGFHPLGQRLDGKRFVGGLVQHVFGWKNGFDQRSQPVEVGFLRVLRLVFRLQLASITVQPGEVAQVNQACGERQLLLGQSTLAWPTRLRLWRSLPSFVHLASPPPAEAGVHPVSLRTW